LGIRYGQRAEHQCRGSQSQGDFSHEILLSGRGETATAINASYNGDPAHQQGAHQHRPQPLQTCRRPGGHQRPQPPQAALWMIVAFRACAFMLEAPWVWAFATASEPSTNAAAAKVTVIFRMGSSSWWWWNGEVEN
jgi:hypothetical protein